MKGRSFFNKHQKKFAKTKIKRTFAIPFGRLAQLVQSVCLTSRGSAVRIRHLPPETKAADNQSSAAFILFLTGILLHRIADSLLKQFDIDILNRLSPGEGGGQPAHLTKFKEDRFHPYGPECNMA